MVPLALRGQATAYMISTGVTYVMYQCTDEWAYRFLYALQWIFPKLPFKSIRRLGSKAAPEPTEVLVMMVRNGPREDPVNRAELREGTRWMLAVYSIICGVYMA
jgi:hypothetical protein